MKANLTKYAFIVQTNCPMWPNHCVMIEHPLGEYVKFEDAVVGSSDIAQQLQAKIRAVADGLEIAYRGADPMAVDNAINELRELSAVQ